MDRRDFIKTGAVLGIATVGLLGNGSCTSGIHSRSISERLKRLDMDNYLAMVDRTMVGLDEFVCDSENPFQTYDEIGRIATRSLAMSSMFRELPLEGQLHPGMQMRILSSVKEMDEAVFDHSSLIARTGLAADSQIREAIRSPSNPGLAFLERFDSHASDMGVSMRTRFRLRSIGTDALKRMKRESPEIVFSEARGKALQMRRMAELAGSVEEANKRIEIMRSSSRAYDEKQRKIERIVESWDKIYVASNDPLFAQAPSFEDEVAEIQKTIEETPADAGNDADAGPIRTPSPSLASKECDDQIKSARAEGFQAGKAAGYKQALKQARIEKAQSIILAGGWTLGIAGGTALVGVALMEVSPIVTLVMSGTVGGVLLIVGLIILGVGAAMKAKALKA